MKEFIMWIVKKLGLIGLALTIAELFATEIERLLTWMKGLTVQYNNTTSKFEVQEA